MEADAVNSWGPITPLVSREPNGDKVLQHRSDLKLLLGLYHSICVLFRKLELELGSMFQRDASPLPPISLQGAWGRV